LFRSHERCLPRTARNRLSYFEADEVYGEFMHPVR
jgi:hypothetical protein